MSDWRDTAKLIGLRVTGWRARAFDYLEQNGMRFCAHFGTDNAVAIARQHWNERKKKRPAATPDRICRPGLSITRNRR